MLLKDNYNSYQVLAEYIPNWKKINKNDLCNLYIAETDPYMQNRYMAAIMCRYWPAFEASYNKSSGGAAVEDAYNWFLDAIMYALKSKAWTNPDSKLYTDPNGPDKCINVCIASRRNTFFQQSNRFNRKINHEVDSIDRLSEEYKDSYVPKSVNKSKIDYDSINLVRKNFLSGNIFFAVMIDLILNSDIFTESKFDINMLIKSFKKLDDKYAEYFSSFYQLNYDKVYINIITFAKASKKQLHQNIEFNLNSLSVK